MKYRSPFPGMDPFLEISPRWEIFHGWFMRELARQNLPKARELDCWIDVERDVYQRDPSGQLLLVGEPDATLAQQPAAAGWNAGAATSTAVALAEPKAVHEVVLDPDQLERHKQEYLLVREQGQFQRVLAVVELLSFANKEGNYAPKYREKRERMLTARSHFMEIDFLRAGANPSRDLFPELPPAPYFIFVARKHEMGRHEQAYPLRLQDRLPTVALPLGAGRPDLPLDLAAAFESAYDLSFRASWARYAEEPVPPPPLSPEDAEWVRQLVSKL